MPSPQSKRWCFTLNNPTDPEKTELADKLSDTSKVKYAVVGRETGTNNTPHLQGYVVFKTNQRFNAAKAYVSVRCHIEVARGTNQEASDYCKKDGDFDEYGELPQERGGTPNVLDTCIEWGKQFIADNGRAPTSTEIATHHPVAWVRFPRAIEVLSLLAPPPILRDGEPNEWQQSLIADLAETADDRSITFYVDPEGGKGKTWFQQWYASKHPEKVQLLSIAKRDDLAHMIDPLKSVFFFNVPRTQMEYLQYSILESLKDKMVISGKYNSTMKLFRHNNHVIVFSNEAPDPTKLSADRMNVIYLSEAHNITN